VIARLIASISAGFDSATKSVGALIDYYIVFFHNSLIIYCPTSRPRMLDLLLEWHFRQQRGRML
jgi:hypothetical protein